MLKVHTRVGDEVGVEITGLCFVNINRTDEGVIIDVYDPKGETCVRTMAFTDVEFEDMVEEDTE